MNLLECANCGKKTDPSRFFNVGLRNSEGYFFTLCQDCVDKLKVSEINELIDRIIGEKKANVE